MVLNKAIDLLLNFLNFVVDEVSVIQVKLRLNLGFKIFCNCIRSRVNTMELGNEFFSFKIECLSGQLPGLRASHGFFCFGYGFGS